MSGNGHRGSTSGAEAEFAGAREQMVEYQIARRGVRDPRVLDAMRRVPRHEFVAPELRRYAYDDKPLPIGEEQTISQPYIVAAMSEALQLTGSERVLEVGGGCGYLAAVLSLLAREVHAVEWHASLAADATSRLADLGYANVQVHSGDGSEGWPAHAPYDGILVSAAAPEVPPPLLEQLSDGGRLVIPVGGPDQQDMLCLLKGNAKILRQVLYPCRFVPLVGRYGWPRQSKPASHH